MEPGQSKDEQQNEVLSKVNLEMLAKNINFVQKIRAKDLAEVKRLLNEADVNFVNIFHDQNTPLHYAVATGEPELVELLLNHGAKIDAKNLLKVDPFELVGKLPKPLQDQVRKVFQDYFRKNRVGKGKGKKLKVVQNANSKVPTFNKRSGTAAKGQYFETKLITLVLLRALDRFDTVYLGSNLDEAKAFDDLVLRVHDGDETKRIIFIQAKHIENGKCNDFIDLINEKDTSGIFHLSKYFESYLYLRLVQDAGNNMVLSGIFDGTEVMLVIFTTAKIKYSNCSKVDSKDILFTKDGGEILNIECTDSMRKYFSSLAIQWHRAELAEILAKYLRSKNMLLLNSTDFERPEGPSKPARATDAGKEKIVNGIENLRNLVLKTSDDCKIDFDGIKLLAFQHDAEFMSYRHEDVKTIKEMMLSSNVLQDIPNLLLAKEMYEELIEQFFQIFRIYSAQASERELEVVIQNELRAQRYDEVASMYFKCHNAVTNWWKLGGEVYFLTEACDFFSKADSEIELETFDTVCRKTVDELGLAYNLNGVNWISQLDEGLRLDKYCLNLYSSSPELTKVKLMQYFITKNSLSIEFRSIMWNGNNSEQILEVILSAKPPCLVLIIDGDIELKILEDIQKQIKMFIFITAHIVDGSWELAQDANHGLEDLIDSCKQNVLDKTIEFQGQTIPLHLLLGNDPDKLINQHMLLRLAKNKKCCVSRQSISFNGDKMWKYYIERYFKLPSDPLAMISEIDRKQVIVTAEPGMGKSISLEMLARKIKEEDPASWVFKIDLIKCTKQFNQWKMNKTEISADVALEFLVNVMKYKAERVDDTAEAFENSVTHWFCNNDKIVLLIDGFDEICPDYEHEVLKLLEIFQRKFCKKLWITCREGNVLTRLTNIFNQFPPVYNLRPFTVEDSKLFLWKFWKHELNLDDGYQSKFQLFVAKLFAYFKTDIFPQETELMCVPLQVKMVATVFQPYFEAFCAEDPDINSLLPKTLDLISLYENFFNITFMQIKRKDKGNIDDTIPDNLIDALHLKEKYANEHKRSAFVALFDQCEVLVSEQVGQATLEHFEKVKASEEKTGIIYSVLEGKPIFIHRSYAEYFAAWFIWDYYRMLPEDKFVSFINKFVMEILIRSEIWAKVCEFFLRKSQLMIDDVNNKTKKSCYLLSKILEYTEIVKGNFTSKPRSLLLGIVEASLDGLFCPASLEETLTNNSNRLNWLLIECSCWGYIKLFRLTANHESVREVNPPYGAEYGRTPLHFAAKAGNVEIVRFLLELGVDPNTKASCRQRYALALASENGRRDVVELLLDGGAEINQKNELGFTALHFAAIKDESEIAELLLTRGAFKDSCVEGRTPLLITVCHRSVKVIKVLLDADANPNICDDSGREPIHEAASKGFEDVMALLLEKGILVNSPNSLNGLTPLHYAAQYGHTNVVNMLLRNNAQKNVPDTKFGTTPLHRAALFGQEEVAQLLLDKGADPNSRTLTTVPYPSNDDCNYDNRIRQLFQDGSATPLHMASLSGSKPIVQLLLQKGASIDDTTAGNGQTALLLAAANGHIDVVSELVRKNANLTIRNGNGRTAADEADANFHECIANVLDDAVRREAR